MNVIIYSDEQKNNFEEILAANDERYRQHNKQR